MRKLTLLEKILIKKLMLLIPSHVKLRTFNLDQLYVQEMNDGEMGSLIFLTHNKTNRLIKQYIVNGYCLDSDNTPIYIGLNIDSENYLYELDSWKTNNTPLIMPLGTNARLFDEEWNEIFSDI